MTTEILLCVYLLRCKLEPNQCNIEERHKHRIGSPKVDERSIRMEIVFAVLDPDKEQCTPYIGRQVAST